MKEPIIRDATLSDGSDLAELSTQLGYPTEAHQVAPRLEAILEAGDQKVLVACTPDGQVVGWIHIFQALRVESDAFAELGGLVVIEELRGRGIGRLLLAAAEDWAQGRGLTKLRVRIRTHRTEAVKFYDRMAFQPTKEQRIFDKDLGPAGADPQKKRR